MNKDQMKAFDQRLEEVVDEIGTHWDSGAWDMEEMNTVGIVGIALQLRRLNNLIESIRKEENEKEARNG